MDPRRRRQQCRQLWRLLDEVKRGECSLLGFTQVAASLEVVVHAKTDRRPRELVNQALLMRQRASAIARQVCTG